MSDSILNPGEVVIRKASGKEYVRLGGISAWLTLTNQRLIVQRLLGSASAYPLSHVTQASEYEYWPPLIAVFPFKLLRIDFDNQGSLLLGLLGLQTWVQEIEQAKAKAPPLPYTTVPTPYVPHASQSLAPMLRWVWIGMVAVSIVTFCICVPIFVLVLLNLNSR